MVLSSVVVEESCVNNGAPIGVLVDAELPEVAWDKDDGVPNNVVQACTFPGGGMLLSCGWVVLVGSESMISLEFDIAILD
jgi:hypothetical protein